MTPSREEALSALVLEQPADKSLAFLDAVCDGDPAMRQRLYALLAAHELSGGLLSDAPPAVKATIKLELAAVEDEALGPRRVHLNTKKVYETSGAGLGGGIYEPDDVALKAGLNVLVFRIVNGKTGWGDCSICFKDAQGNPAKGMQVTLNPDTKQESALEKP